MGRIIEFVIVLVLLAIFTAVYMKIVTTKEKNKPSKKNHDIKR